MATDFEHNQISLAGIYADNSKVAEFYSLSSCTPQQEQQKQQKHKKNIHKSKLERDIEISLL